MGFGQRSACCSQCPSEAKIPRIRSGKEWGWGDDNRGGGGGGGDDNREVESLETLGFKSIK